MSEKKHKRGTPSSIELSLPEDLGFILEPTEIEIGSGYTVSMSYDEDGNPIVAVKTFGEVDSAKVRKDIKRLYPNAQIRQLNHEPTVTVVRKRKRKGKAKAKK